MLLQTHGKGPIALGQFSTCAILSHTMTELSLLVDSLDCLYVCQTRSTTFCLFPVIHIGGTDSLTRLYHIGCLLPLCLTPDLIIISATPAIHSWICATTIGFATAGPQHSPGKLQLLSWLNCQIIQIGNHFIVYFLVVLHIDQSLMILCHMTTKIYIWTTCNEAFVVSCCFVMI